MQSNRVASLLGLTNSDTFRSGGSSNQIQSGGSGISPPIVQGDLVQAAPVGRLFGAHSTHRASPFVAQDYADVLNVSLKNLRIGNEPDANLVNIPSLRRVRLPDLNPPHDDRTSHLSGTELFTELGRDDRLPFALQNLCGGRKLALSITLSSAALSDYSEKLRFIASRCHSGSEEFKTGIDDLALEAQAFCGDRTAYFIEQMHGLAVLDLLSSSGVTHDVQLFNLGVAFYKLDLVRNETCKLLKNAPQQRESVEDLLNAEYLLQDELGLPTRHARPIHQYVGNVSAEVAQQIKTRVLNRILDKDGVYVIDFLSEWQPWAKYVENLDSNQADFEELQSAFTDNLGNIMNKPFIPEVIKIERAQDLMDRYRCWKAELVGQKSREFLINFRANHLIEIGSMPQYFTREVR